MKDLVDTLTTMRFDIEGILLDVSNHVRRLPECHSQSFRAHAALEAINSLPFAARGRWIKDASTLEDFLTLRKALLILERE